jgi:hypothetical protein
MLRVDVATPLNAIVTRWRGTGRNRSEDRF